MSIWVRSQSGLLLINVNYVRIVWENAPENQFGIYGDCHNSDSGEIEDHFLGSYPTEDEALAVLNQIQDYIKHLILAPGQYPVVYRMPEAGFTKLEKFIPDCGGDLNCCGIVEGSKEGKCSHYAECKAAWDRGCR